MEKKTLAYDGAALLLEDELCNFFNKKTLYEALPTLLNAVNYTILDKNITWW